MVLMKLRLPELMEVLEEIDFLSVSGRVASLSSWRCYCITTVWACKRRARSGLARCRSLSRGDLEVDAEVWAATA
jgi:hypothetical protein